MPRMHQLPALEMYNVHFYLVVLHNKFFQKIRNRSIQPSPLHSTRQPIGWTAWTSVIRSENTTARQTLRMQTFCLMRPSCSSNACAESTMPHSPSVCNIALSRCPEACYSSRSERTTACAASIMRVQASFLTDHPTARTPTNTGREPALNTWAASGYARA